VLLEIVVCAVSYLFIIVQIHDDKLGNRTLSGCFWLVYSLRGLGHLLDGVRGISLTPAVYLLLFAILIVTARYLIIYFHQSDPQTTLRVLAFIESSALLLAACLFLINGNLLLAALAGFLLGIILLALPAETSTTNDNLNKFFFLIPLGLGLVLRFYALAQVPNGYAQHAAVLDGELSLPLKEALSSSLSSFNLQPFLGLLGDMLLHQQAGALATLEALGFEIFGVSLMVTRLVTAALGTLTLYIAYRLGQALGGTRLGLAFSFLLAVSPWHITISRYATAEHVVSPLFFLLCLWFIVRSLNGGRIIDIFLAAFFTSINLLIYATNLVVPVIAFLFLLYRGLGGIRQAITRWKLILLGLGFFLVLSYMPLSQLFPLGIFGPNLRTGYMGSGPLLSNWPERLKMVGLEVDQLFIKTNDPWFTTQGAALGTLQTALLLPGILLALMALFQKQYRDLGFLIMIGLTLGALPAVFAPDASFRRLMLVTTLAALAAAFAIVRLLDAARYALVPRKIIQTVLCAGAIALSASGTFGYFDRTFLGEELGNAWFRAMGAAAIDHLGKERMIFVVPNSGDIDNVKRYLKLMAYDRLNIEQSKGIPQEDLFVVASCEDTALPVNGDIADSMPRLIILPDFLPPLPPPCGSEFIARLTALHPGSTILLTTPPPLPADLMPAEQ
jgi:hypothetical protein